MIVQVYSCIIGCRLADGAPRCNEVGRANCDGDKELLRHRAGGYSALADP